jgi:CheY-like chemotaxis protein
MAEATPRRKLVLVVDDDATIRTMVAKALAAKGYDVEEAADGMVASELLGRMKQMPDLMICDVMMPTIDGFSLARMVKGHKELRSIPIIFLTAKTQPADLKIGISLSIVDLLDKVAKSIR